MNARSLKPKHVEALVRRWQREDRSIGTIKNRMAALRWWVHKIDRRHVVARSKDHYGIPERSFVSTESKAKQVGRAALGTLGSAECSPGRRDHGEVAFNGRTRRPKFGSEHRALLGKLLLRPNGKTFAEALASMPSVGEDDDLERMNDPIERGRVVD